VRGVCLIICLLAAAPASALAAPVSLRDGVLRYEPTDARSAAQLYSSATDYVVHDWPSAQAGEGCTTFMGVPRCEHGGAQAAVFLRFGPQDDFLSMREMTAYRGSTVRAGDGNDTLKLGAGPDVALGGPGSDMLEGGAGDDYLRGEEGVDRLDGGAGADRLDGGPGSDLVDYHYDFEGSPQDGLRRRGVRVTIGAGADDGEPGEGDDVVEAERVRGTVARDVLVGTAGDDELDGSEDADVLRGGGGDDYLIADAVGIRIVDTKVIAPKRGVDVLSGGAGNDTIDLGHYMDRPAHVETDRVSCGPGRDRLLSAWLAPGAVPADCEELCGQQRACQHLARVARGTRSLRLRGNRVTIPVTCPAVPIPQHECVGRLVLRSPGGKVVGKARYEVANGATRGVSVRLRRRVGRVVANLEGGAGALWRTTLRVR
jgi:Ca2+-binding RTX toxin-like protein